MTDTQIRFHSANDVLICDLPPICLWHPFAELITLLSANAESRRPGAFTPSYHERRQSYEYLNDPYRRMGAFDDLAGALGYI